MASSKPPSRREALHLAGALAASAFALPALSPAREADAPTLLVPATGPTTTPADPWPGLKVGLASYSYRKLPLEQAIKGIQRVALRYVSIKDFHLPLNSTAEQRKAVAKNFIDAGIQPISCGVIALKGDQAASRNAFEYARDIGVSTIVCSPEPAALAMLEKLVKEFDIRLAIHNHGPGDKYPSPNEVFESIKDLDERIGLCIDVGHTARAHVDPVNAILKYKTRLYDIHFKDVAYLDRGPSAEIEVGRGILDIRGMLKALVQIGYAHHVGFEHEKDRTDPIPGVAESVGYTKAALMAVVGG